MEMPRHSEAGQTLVIDLSGEIIMEMAADLKAELMLRIETSTKPEVELDLGQVTFMDSSGVGLLIGIRRMCQEQGKAFRLANPSPPIRKLFDMLRLTGFFAITADATSSEPA